MAQPPRIGILVVAYNASTTLRSVLARIDPAFRGRVTSVLVSDDHSADDTYGVGLEVQRVEAGVPMTVVRQPRNLGYGGNQKFGYRWAVEHDLDIVVMLHGDGQYAPELLADIVGPVERGDADVVMGSRMMVPGAARAGGMPRYKYLGNRILTQFQNAVSGLHLSEWHSGYRAFSVAALARIPFEQNSDGFDFDTEVLLQLHDSGARIVEVPIPTYYGDEICYVDGVAYARAVVADVVRYRLQRVGFGDDSLAVTNEAYERKPGDDSSHARLVDWLANRPIEGEPTGESSMTTAAWLKARRTSGAADPRNSAMRILDLGCADGFVAEELRRLGHHVTGVDVVARPGVKDRVDHFVEADLDRGLPISVADSEPFDVVLAADVLEHVRDPEALLRELRDVLRSGGRLLVSVPNFGHWYPRLRVASGRFDYDRRGILDRGHVRFFTQRSFERVLHRSGWHVLRREATGLPFDVADRGGSGGLAGRLRRTVGGLDGLGVRLRPTLFGYQLLYELEPALGRV